MFFILNTSKYKYHKICQSTKTYGVWVIALFVFALAESRIYFTSMFQTKSLHSERNMNQSVFYDISWQITTKNPTYTCKHNLFNLNVVALNVNSQNPLKMTHTQPITNWLCVVP